MTPETAAPVDLIGLSEMARLVGFSRTTIESDILRGIIPVVVIAGHKFVRRQDALIYRATRSRARQRRAPATQA